MMQTLNFTLEKQVREADGRYFESQELAIFEYYVQSYSLRLETYQNLRDHSRSLVLQALKKLAQSQPELLQKHGQRCQYDMGEVLRYTALAVLRDDEIFFKDQIMSWLDTILLAHKRQSHCAQAYRYLQEAISANLPSTNSTLIYPYLASIITVLQTHA